MKRRLSRRRLLSAVAALGSLLPALRLRAADGALEPTPAMTEGPFYPESWPAAPRPSLIAGALRAGEPLALSGSVRDLDPYELGEAGSLFLTRPRLADHMADAAAVQRRADDVFAAILEGKLVIEIADHLDFGQIAEGMARIEAREQIGKSVAWIGAARGP